jgi:flavin reductase (DIM6/NTAB) family NADH-FMN oxidoreductase RutF
MPVHDDALASGMRHAMSQLAVGVVMVTTTIDGRPRGVTVSACCSVSMEPPMLLISLLQTTASAQAILKTNRFGVSILGARALETARYGSALGVPKFIEAYCRGDVPKARTPGIAGAIAHIHCEIAEVVRGGDHVIFLGHVVKVDVGSEGDNPLVYYDRRYHHLTDESDVVPLRAT